MKTNKDYYADRQYEKLIGEYVTEEDDLLRTVVFSVVRNRKDSYLLKYLKREKINIPMSVIKRVIKKNKKAINDLEPFYDYRVKEGVLEDMKNDLVTCMRDYRIGQLGLG